MAFFEKYAPNDKPETTGTPLDIVIRKAVVNDSPALAMLKFKREGGDLSLATAEFENEINAAMPDSRLLIVAEAEDKIIGFARASYFNPPDNSPANVCPEGWYLAGVIVHPKYRRQGVAYKLTIKRLEWIADKADFAYYFANAQNQVSINLHDTMGFTELTRDFTYPNVTFDGGVGILFKANLDRYKNN